MEMDLCFGRLGRDIDMKMRLCRR